MSSATSYNSVLQLITCLLKYTAPLSFIGFTSPCSISYMFCFSLWSELSPRPKSPWAACPARNISLQFWPEHIEHFRSHPHSWAAQETVAEPALTRSSITRLLASQPHEDFNQNVITRARWAICPITAEHVLDLL